MLRTALLALTFIAPSFTALADQTIHDVPVPGSKNTVLHYTLSVPDKADLTQPLPVLIVFPPGDQGPQMEGAARAMFTNECYRRGWALVTPQPPAPSLFFQQIDLLRLLIDDLDKALVPEGNKYHVAGGSNGGRSAMAFALTFPSRTASVAAFPGGIIDPPAEEEMIERLKGIPIHLWVGGDDTVAWNDTGKALEALGKRSKGTVEVTLTIVPGQGHVIRSLGAGAILDQIEKHRKGTGTVGRTELDVLGRLDALHAAASKSDFDAYFANFAPDAVFIGTDAGERWTLAEFKAYALPHFQKGSGKGGWTYVPRMGSRHVTVLPDAKGKPGTVAFFDELLDNENYGTTRGTGVLTLVTSGEGDKATTEWKVSQYSLSIPIPNAIAKRVTAMVKTEEKKK